MGEYHGLPVVSDPDLPDGTIEIRKRRKRKLPKIISRAEATALLESIESDPRTGLRDRLMCEFMYRAGLRVSEVVKLYPRDVDRDGVIHIYDAKGGDGTAYFTPDEILPRLDAWYQIRASWVLGEQWPHPVFIRRDLQPISIRYIQRLVQKHKARVGIRGIVTPHVFRHTFATERLEEGFQLTEVQALLRHAHLATTAVYLHVRDESLRRKMASRRPLPEREEV